MELKKASSTLKCSELASHACQNDGMDKLATGILKCWPLTRLACQIDGVEESIEHFEMLGTHKAGLSN
jgi:hypothetical protein